MNNNLESRLMIKLKGTKPVIAVLVYIIFKSEAFL